jgi:hypothetical protein
MVKTALSLKNYTYVIFPSVLLTFRTLVTAQRNSVVQGFLVPFTVYVADKTLDTGERSKKGSIPYICNAIQMCFTTTLRQKYSMAHQNS